MLAGQRQVQKEFEFWESVESGKKRGKLWRRSAIYPEKSEAILRNFMP